ncbi:sey1 [Colletotrichum abscissum]|uniref:sey1 n=1 Tax=Colletotrichum abscissum TaxID=1671311 RepID=UPI0027D4B4D3|nr:sey1 [Colletotrichum abscissum]KAK1492839.1 sey1 [Colletotrichum abscissum]
MSSELPVMVSRNVLLDILARLYNPSHAFIFPATRACKSKPLTFDIIIWTTALVVVHSKPTVVDRDDIRAQHLDHFVDHLAAGDSPVDRARSQQHNSFLKLAQSIYLDGTRTSVQIRVLTRSEFCRAMRRIMLSMLHTQLKYITQHTSKMQLSVRADKNGATHINQTAHRETLLLTETSDSMDSTTLDRRSYGTYERVARPTYSDPYAFHAVAGHRQQQYFPAEHYNRSKHIHLIGLYNGANMGLFKTVFEVKNMQLFLKDKESSLRSLLFLVIRDHLGTTPLANLRNTLVQDLTKIWSSISKTKTGNCRA